MSDVKFEWSLAATHCVWCGLKKASDAEWAVDHDGHSEFNEDPGCWCMARCWGTCGESVFGDRTVAGLRGLAEAQAVAIAELALRAREQWAPYQRAEDPSRAYWLRTHPDRGSIEHVDMAQGIYDAVFGDTEGTP